VANALKFSNPDRPLSIRVFSERRSSKVQISIADNGIGIDPNIGTAFLVCFERLSPSGNSVGTGIGLAIVKRSVEKWAALSASTPLRVWDAPFGLNYRRLRKKNLSPNGSSRDMNGFDLDCSQL